RDLAGADHGLHGTHRGPDAGRVAGLGAAAGAGSPHGTIRAGLRPRGAAQRFRRCAQLLVAGPLLRRTLFPVNRSVMSTESGTGTARKTDLLSLPADEAERELARHFAARGQRGYRVCQVLRWLHERDALGFGE